MAKADAQLVQELQDKRQQYAMMGQESPYGDLQEGDDLNRYVLDTYYKDPSYALSIAERYGIPKDQLDQQIAATSGPNPKKHGGLGGVIQVAGNTMAKVGETFEKYPALYFAPLAIAGATGGFAASGGAAGVSGTAAAPAAGAAAVPAGYSGLSTIPGAADVVVTAPAAAAGGAGAASAIASGGAAALNGLASPPQPSIPQGMQGPPEPVAPAPAATGLAGPSESVLGGVMTGSGGGNVAGGALSGLTRAFAPVATFLKDNKDLVGAVVAGIGSGLAAGAEADSQRDLLRERHDLTASNYGKANPATGFRGLAAGTSTARPDQRFDPHTYGGWAYKWNQQTGTMDRVPIEPVSGQGGP